MNLFIIVKPVKFTTWKVSIFRVFLVHIFPHLDWIGRDTEYMDTFHAVVIKLSCLICPLSSSLFYQSWLHEIIYFRYKEDSRSLFSCFFFFSFLFFSFFFFWGGGEGFCVLVAELSRNQDIRLAGYIFSNAFPEKGTEKFEIISVSIWMERNTTFSSLLHNITNLHAQKLSISVPLLSVVNVW